MCCYFDDINNVEDFDFDNILIDSIYKRIKYLRSVKSDITCIISHSYMKVKVDSYDSLPLEKTMTFRNVMIFLKSV